MAKLVGGGSVINGPTPSSLLVEIDFIKLYEILTYLKKLWVLTIGNFLQPPVPTKKNLVYSSTVCIVYNNNTDYTVY